MKIIVILMALALFLTGCGYEPAMTDVPQFLTVVIDAGHGGKDGGASTADGVKESSINLQISQRLEYLMVLLGYNVVMTRADDTHVGDTHYTKAGDLKARLDIAENCGADILISIHQNHFSDSRYGGAQVFYGRVQGSSLMAEYIQQDLNLVDGGNRKIKDGCETAFLMKNAGCTAVLAECGFLSNPADAQNLQAESFQKKTAMAIAAGTMKYKGENPDES